MSKGLLDAPPCQTWLNGMTKRGDKLRRADMGQEKERMAEHCVWTLGFQCAPV